MISKKYIDLPNRADTRKQKVKFHLKNTFLLTFNAFTICFQEQQYVVATKDPFFLSDKLIQKLEQFITNISMFSQSDMILLITFFQTPIIGYKGIQQRLTSHSISTVNLKTA